MMNKTTIFILLLVCVAFAHKGKKDERREPNSIYQPFTDLPAPSQEVVIVDPTKIESEKLVHEHKQNEQRSQEKQQQIQEFNEMLGYGLVFGTILLSLMLLRTCGNHKRHMRQQRVVVGPASQNMMTHVPMLNKNVNSGDIKNKIQWHKMEIKRLEHEAKQIEQNEIRMMQERKRQEQTIKAYYNQVELQQTIQPQTYYSQPFYPQYQYNGNIPVGRPIPRDNDSSFASQYPTI